MALTATQLADIQADLGISDDEAVFTDDELDRLYDRADSSYELTVALAVRQLLMTAAKRNDYTAGMSTEKKSQVFAQLKQMYEVWMTEAGGGYAPLVEGTIVQDFQEPGDTSTEYS